MSHGAFASYSHMLKTSAAQLLLRGLSSKQQYEPNYPDAYGATQTDMILRGLSPHFLPPDAHHVTSTCVPFKQADDISELGGSKFV